MTRISANLPDEIWLYIGLHLDSLSLISAQKSLVPGLARIARDAQLWSRIRIVSQDLRKSTLRSIVPHLGPHTRSLRIRGSRPGKPRSKAARKAPTILSSAFMQSVKLHCTQLTHLALEHLTLDVHTGFLSLLPRSVTRFSLEGSHILNLPFIRTSINSPLAKIARSLPLLEELNLRHTESWSLEKDLNGPIKSKTILQIFLTRKTWRQEPPGTWTDAPEDIDPS